MNTLQLNWKTNHLTKPNRGFSNDVTTAVLVSQNNETAAMLVSQTDPMGVELQAFFFSKKFVRLLAVWVKGLHSTVATEIRQCLFARYLRIKSQLFKNTVQSSTLMCSLVTSNRQPGQTVILAKPVKKLENSWLKPRLILQKAKTVLWFTPLSPKKIAW